MCIRDSIEVVEVGVNVVAIVPVAVSYVIGLVAVRFGISLVNAIVPVVDGVVIVAELPPVNDVIVLLVNVSVVSALIYNAPFVNWLLFVGIWLTNANVPVVDGVVIVDELPPVNSVIVLLVKVSVEDVVKLVEITSLLITNGKVAVNVWPTKFASTYLTILPVALLSLIHISEPTRPY